jgi:recombination protein RecT
MTAQTVSSAVAQRDSGIVNVMWDRKTHFAAVLPDHIDVKSFLGTAAGALYASPALMNAAEKSPDSLITAMMRCAALGHQPGTDEYYLTPRTVKGRPVVLGIEGYRGVIERMYRSGAVKTVIVREVCARDKFRYVEGRDEKPQHSFGGPDAYDSTGADFFGAAGSRDRGEMVGVYAYAILTTGAVSRVAILNRDDVMAARDAGGYRPDDEYSPWNRADAGKGHPEFTGRSMWWKTGAKRLEPWVPTSAEYRREQLRAAVQAAGPVAQPPASNGAGHLPLDIHDAEVVEDPGPADETPASGPAAGPGRVPQPPKPSKKAADELTRLMRQVPLGGEKDVAAFIGWVTGHPADQELTRPDVTALTTVLEDALERAGGDTAEAAHQIWVQHKRATGRQEPGDG